MSDTPQKSELHSSTADASTSPTSKGDRATTRARANEDAAPEARDRVEPSVADAVVVDDQTDSGGPLRITSGDPDLQPPLDVPKDPFPTDRTPEIDPPVNQPRNQTRR